MKHKVTIEIDADGLKSLTDEWLKVYWSVAQANPAPYDDAEAGELAERISDEIVRRWLKDTPAEMYNHSTSQVYHRELVRHCICVDGQWVPRPVEEPAND